MILEDDGWQLACLLQARPATLSHQLPPCRSSAKKLLRQRLQKGRGGGMLLSKVRFLSVVGAKLRTEVVAVRRPPKFKDEDVGRPPDQHQMLEIVAADYGER